jgi:hypothetical protein
MAADAKSPRVISAASRAFNGKIIIDHSGWVFH